MEFLAVLAVVAVAWSVWMSFGDESVTDEGAGDAGSEGGEEAGSSEATSEESGDVEGPDKFTEALTKAKLKNWAETGKRWYEKSQKVPELEQKLAEYEAKVKEYETKAASAPKADTRRSDLIKQAVEQGFSRKEAREYLEDYSLDELEARLAEDREEEARKSGKPAKPDKEVLDRISKLEKAITVKEQNAELQRQLGESLGKHAADFDNEDKALIVGFLEQMVESARSSGQKLPSIDESVKNLAARMKSVGDRAVTKFKETNKGKAYAGTAEQPNKQYEEQVSSMESDEQQMLEVFRKSK